MMTPETKAKISAAEKGKPRSAAHTEAIIRAASGDGAIAIPASPLTINVRHFHKSGLLRDQTAFVALKWKTGDHLLAAADREKVKLHYLKDDEEASETIPVTWSDDRPWFTCACGRPVTKLYSTDGHAFACRPCDDAAKPYIEALKAQRRKPLRRVPARTRIKVLAREGFRCRVCGSDDGLTVIWLEPRLAREEYPEEFNATALCGYCRPKFRSAAGRIELGLQAVAREADQMLCDATSPQPLSLLLGFLDEQSNGDSDSENAPAAWATRKERTKKRHEQRFRIMIRYLAGQSVQEIARKERISRWTVRRQLRKHTKLVAGICSHLKRQAVWEKEWRVARFWHGLLKLLDADGDWVKPTGGEVGEWTKRLDMLRWHAMNQSDVEAVSAPAWTVTQVAHPTDEQRTEMMRLTGIDCSPADIDIVRQLMWSATTELDIMMERSWPERTEADRDAISKMAAERGFWAAIYEPIMLRLFRVGLKDYLRNQAA